MVVQSSSPGGGTSAITVAVRVRPFFEAATSEPSHSGGGGLKRIVNVLDERVLIFDPEEPGTKTRTYAHGARRSKEIRYGFDRVFAENASQRDVYEGTAQPLLDGILSGFNATVFAYGATGCGKTHTITGTPQDPGIIFLTMRDLFQRMEHASKEYVIESTVSYLEVYNETIRDLLSPSGSNQSLDVREDDLSSRVVVARLSEHRPRNVDDVMQMLLKGNANRTRAPTEANAVSSRSHAVLQIHIRKRSKSAAVQTRFQLATLSIIDLAGSERASSTKNKGDRLLEGANINRSLLALGNCINALCSDKPNHIPYRDSKLTRLLKYSLSGNCRVVMITNISPSSMHYDETHNTLKYANRAKNIKTKVEQNTLDVTAHLVQYPKVIEELQDEVEQLRKELVSAQNREASTDSTVDEEGAKKSVANEFMTPNAFLMIWRKVEYIFKKIAEKQKERAEALGTVAQNERKIGVLNAAIRAIPAGDFGDCGPGAYAKELKTALDTLYAANINLRHNANEARLGILRNNAEIEKILERSTKGRGARRMSPEQISQLKHAVQDLQLSAQHETLMKEIDANGRQLEDQSKWLESAINTLMDLSCMLHVTLYDRSSHADASDVDRAVSVVLDGFLPEILRLVGIPQEDSFYVKQFGPKTSVPDLEWDTASEASDDASDAETNLYAESDSEAELDTPQLDASFGQFTLDPAAPSETGDSSTTLGTTPRKRKAPSAHLVQTAIRVQTSDPSSGQPHGQKRQASPGFDSALKKPRSIANDLIHARNCTTPPPRAEPGQNGDDDNDDDPTPIGRKQDTDGRFGGALPPTRLDFLSSPAQRTRRRPRESLIPTMRVPGRRESMLPMSTSMQQSTPRQSTTATFGTPNRASRIPITLGNDTPTTPRISLVPKTPQVPPTTVRRSTRRAALAAVNPPATIYAKSPRSTADTRSVLSDNIAQRPRAARGARKAAADLSQTPIVATPKTTSRTRRTPARTPAHPQTSDLEQSQPAVRVSTRASTRRKA